MPSPRPNPANWPREPWQDPDWFHHQEAWRGEEGLLAHNAVPSSEAQADPNATEALRESLQTLAQTAALQVQQMLELRSAFSAELTRLRRRIEQLEGREQLVLTKSKPEWFDSARTELDLLKDDRAGVHDPDAANLSQDALEHVIRLLGKLPVDIQKPEIGVDAQGNVTLDWQNRPDRVFSIAVNATGMIFWAGLFGDNRRHGAERFGDNLPIDLERGVRRALVD